MVVFDWALRITKGRIKRLSKTPSVIRNPNMNMTIRPIHTCYSLLIDAKLLVRPCGQITSCLNSDLNYDLLLHN